MMDLQNRTKYEPENSSTAHKIPNATWQISYGDSSYAYGNVWKDTVVVGGINITGAVVESATEVSSQLSSDLDLTGIFGVAFNLTSRVYPPQPTVFDLLNPLLDSKVLTADLKWHADGTYTFGSINSSLYKGDIHYIPLKDQAEFWEFNFTKFHVGGEAYWFLSRWSAILDTGTSLMLLDEEIVKMYWDAVPSAKYNKVYDLWTYPCDTALPDFRLGFDEDWHVTIPGHYINYTYVENMNSTCMGGIQGNMGEEFSVLGDIFLKAVFAIFDYEGKRVGLAEKAQPLS